MKGAQLWNGHLSRLDSKNKDQANDFLHLFEQYFLNTLEYIVLTQKCGQMC